MSLILGIDEAGRGPLIGPMIIAGTAVPEDDFESLLEMGVKDSKKLSREKLISLFTGLKKNYVLTLSAPHLHNKLMGGYRKVLTISAEEIDNSGKSLNTLTKEKTVLIIASLILQIRNTQKIKKVYLDCPEQNTYAYASEIEFLLKRDNEYLPYIPEIIAEHKADENHVPVSLASIFAKHQREASMLSIRAAYKDRGDCGSGYTSDQKTIYFLRDNLGEAGVDAVFRHSWATYRRMKALLGSGEIVRKKRIRKD